MKIQAAVLHQVQEPLSIETVELAPPRAGEVLVQIAAAGVCHSDWHLVTGDTRHALPVVLGHEGAGVVAAVGAGVTRVNVGDRVVLNWTPDCGACFYCLHQQPNLCETYEAPIWAGTLLDGTPRLALSDGTAVYHWCGLACFAEYAVVPEPSCIPIRADVPLEVAALVGCAVATGVGAALYTGQVRAGESVAVFGCGGVGLSAILGARLCGAGQIIAVDANPQKLEQVGAFGATHTVLASEAEQVRALTNGRGADVVIEAVGLPAVQEAAFAATRAGGRLVLAGLAPMGSGTNLPGALITRKEITIKGSYYGSVSPRRDFPLLLDLYVAGKLDLDRLVARRYALDEINTAFAAMLRGDAARGVVMFG